MDKNKPPNTLQSRFGFQDPDLTTPAHDHIVLWLQENAQSAINWLVETARHDPIDLWPEHQANLEQVAKHYNAQLAYAQKQFDCYSGFKDARFEEDKERYAREITNIQKTLAKLATELDQPLAPFPYPAEIVEKQCVEYPIRNGNYMVGFIDFQVDTSMIFPITEIRQENSPSQQAVIKSRRHSNQYFIEVKPKIPSFGELVRQLRLYQTYEAGIYVVATPDLRFRDPLEKEGFAVLPVTGEGIFLDP